MEEHLVEAVAAFVTLCLPLSSWELSECSTTKDHGHHPLQSGILAARILGQEGVPPEQIYCSFLLLRQKFDDRGKSHKVKHLDPAPSPWVFGQVGVVEVGEHLGAKQAAEHLPPGECLACQQTLATALRPHSQLGLLGGV